MNEKSKLLFVVLTICGTLCILGALAVAAILFEANADALTTSNISSGQEHREIVFAIFAWGPSLLTLLTGVGMVTVGVRSITKEDRE
jgi:hypothetical protein